MGKTAKRRWRPLVDFLSGTAIAAVAAALVWHFYPGFWKEPPAAAVDESLERREALQREVLAQQAAEARTAAAGTVAAAGKCALDPLIPPASAADGHATAEHPFPGGPGAKAKVFVRAATDAAARQRPRDAEVALIAACRQNELASSKPTVPLARVLGLLGERYVLAANGDHPPDLRDSLMARARQVLASSAEVYAVALGPNASRSRHARERVLALEQGVLPEDGQVAQEPAPAVVEARRVPARKEEGAPDLRQRAADLARLRAQAEAVSDDPAGFRRRTEEALAQREQCRDDACVRDWYASRRRQLLAEF
jgi:hypothetical protein